MFSFLSFPPEIRVQIYRELLHSKDLEDSRQVIVNTKTNHKSPRDVYATSWSLPPLVYVHSQRYEVISPILRTSRTIYREASKVFYETSFRFQSLHYFRRDIPTVSFPNESLRRIQRAELVMSSTNLLRVDAYIKNLRHFLERFCSLKSLDLIFYVLSNSPSIAFIGRHEFWDLIHSLGPELQRISITLRDRFTQLRENSFNVTLPYYSPAIGWKLCNTEERQESRNEILTWTFRPLKQRAPDGSR